MEATSLILLAAVANATSLADTVPEVTSLADVNSLRFAEAVVAEVVVETTPIVPSDR